MAKIVHSGASRIRARRGSVNWDLLRNKYPSEKVKSNTLSSSKSLKRTDEEYHSSNQERKKLKLTVLIFTYLMYEQDGKLDRKERKLVEKCIKDNVDILAKADVLSMEHWIDHPMSLHKIMRYARQYEYTWDVITEIIESFKETVKNNPSYTEILRILEHKFEAQRDSFEEYSFDH